MNMLMLMDPQSSAPLIIVANEAFYWVSLGFQEP